MGITNGNGIEKDIPAHLYSQLSLTKMSHSHPMVTKGNREKPRNSSVVIPMVSHKNPAEFSEPRGFMSITMGIIITP